LQFFEFFIVMVEVDIAGPVLPSDHAIFVVVKDSE